MLKELYMTRIQFFLVDLETLTTFYRKEELWSSAAVFKPIRA